MRAEIVERFWARVEPEPNSGCWLWTAGRTGSGYGAFSPNRDDTISAHRLAWELTNGPIPDGMALCHKCDVPPCCNPAHIFLGTQRDNIRDCMAKGRKYRKHGSRHHNAKLTEPAVLLMRDRYAQGAHPRDLAAEYGVSIQTIGDAVARRTWSHV